MSNGYLKVIVLFLLCFTFINSSSCVLSKINTNLVVFGNFDEESGKLDIETKLTYVNPDTGEKTPIPGKELLIIVNVTKNNGVNESIEKEVITNGLGWGKRTFYLEDVKEFLVMVKFKGDGTFKENFGTLGGGGNYEQQSYSTTLPEGISLTTCLPILMLIGFLGAAMYASGGNPFGFVDMTTNRGFRMNRNLRKTLFVQGVGGTIGSYAAKGVNVIMAAVAKGQTKDEQKKTEEKEAEKKGDEKKQSEDKNKKETQETGKVAGSTGTLGTPATQESKKVVESKGKETSTREGKSVGLEGDKKTVASGEVKAGTNVSSSFRIASKVLYLIGAVFTGQVNDINFIDRVIQNQVTKNEAELKKNNTTVGEIKDQCEKLVKDEKKQKEENNKKSDKSEKLKNKILEKLNGKKTELKEKQAELKDIKLTKEDKEKVKKEVEELKKEVNVLKEQVTKLDTNIKNLKDENSKIDKDMKIARNTLDKIGELEKTLKGTGVDTDKLSINGLEFSKTLDPEKKGELDKTIGEIGKIVDESNKMESKFNEIVILEKKLEKEKDPETKGMLEKVIMKERGDGETIKVAEYIAEKNGLKEVVKMEEDKVKLNEMATENLKEFKREREKQLEKEMGIIDLAQDIEKGKVPSSLKEEVKAHVSLVNESKERIKNGTASDDDKKIVEQYGRLVAKAETGSNKELVSEIYNEIRAKVAIGIADKSEVKIFKEIDGAMNHVQKIDVDVKNTNEYYNDKLKQVIVEFEKMKNGKNDAEVDKIKNEAHNQIETERTKTLDIVKNQLDRVEFNKEMEVKNLDYFYKEEPEKLISQYGSSAIIQTIINADNPNLVKDYKSLNYDDNVKREQEIINLQMKMGLINREEGLDKVNNRLEWEKRTGKALEDKMSQEFKSGEKNSVDDYVKSYDLMYKFNSDGADQNGELGVKLSEKIDKEIKNIEQKIKNSEGIESAEDKRSSGAYNVKELEEQKKALEQDKKNIDSITSTKEEVIIKRKEEIEIAKAVKDKTEYQGIKKEQFKLSDDEKILEQKKEMDKMNEEMTKKQEEFFAKKKKPKN